MISKYNTKYNTNNYNTIQFKMSAKQDGPWKKLSDLMIGVNNSPFDTFLYVFIHLCLFIYLFILYLGDVPHVYHSKDPFPFSH